MKTLHKIVINDTVNNEYQSSITLGQIGHGIAYYVIITTNRNGENNEFEQRCNTYSEALKQFLEDVKDYAEHTALMNL